MIIGQAFQRALTHYREEHGISERELAGQARVNFTTMLGWLRGRQPRSRERIQQVCDSLGLDSEPILNPGRKCLGLGFSFQVLQSRFAERIAQEPCSAFEIVMLAGVVLHARLLTAGFPLTSTTLPTGQVVMHASQDVHISKTIVSLQWSDTAIVLVVALAGSPPLLSEPLSEATFNHAVEMLKH